MGHEIEVSRRKAEEELGLKRVRADSSGLEHRPHDIEVIRPVPSVPLKVQPPAGQGHYVLIRDGADLQICYADGFVQIIENYFPLCVEGDCEIQLPPNGGQTELADQSEGWALGVKAASAANEFVYVDGGTLQTNADLLATVDSSSTLTARLQDDEGAGSFLWTGVATLGAIGGFFALTRSDSASSETTSVAGPVVLGPPLAAAGLQVNIFDGNGLLLQSVGLNPDGRFTADLGDYAGLVVAKLVDTNGDAGPDYRDEATNADKDAPNGLLAIGWATAGQALTLAITPLTHIAALQAGLSDSESENPNQPPTIPTGTDENAVNTANTNAAEAFGLTGGNVATDEPVALIRGDGSENPDGNAYGAALASISGLEVTRGLTTQQVINFLATQVNGESLSQEGLNALKDGVGYAEGNNPLLGSRASALTDQDDVRPTLTISSEQGGTGSRDVTFTLTFSEVVTGFDVDDIEVDGGTKDTFSGSGRVYTLVVTPEEGAVSNVEIRVSMDVAIDHSGNGNEAASGREMVDTRLPPNPTVTALTANTTIPTITGTIGANRLESDEVLTVSVGDATYRVNPVYPDFGHGQWSLNLATATPSQGTLTPLVDGNAYEVTATITDGGGRRASDSSSNELRIDTTAPYTPTVDRQTTDNTTPTITGGTGTADGLSDDEVLTVTVSGATYTVTDFTQDFVLGQRWLLDLATAIPSQGTLAPLVDGNTYEVTATVTDGAGNSTTDVSSDELRVDSSRPTLNIVLGDVVSGSPIEVTFIFSEPVTGFNSEDIALEGATAGELSGQGDRYSLTINRVDATSEIVVSVPASAARDLAGNLSQGFSIKILPSAPLSVPELTTNAEFPVISGTVSEQLLALNAVFTVRVRGDIYSVPDGDEPISFELTDATYTVVPDASGRWELNLASATPDSGTLGSLNTIDGIYDVIAQARIDERNAVVTDVDDNELVIDRTPPEPPEISPIIIAEHDEVPVIAGTVEPLGEGSKETLTVTLNGATYLVPIEPAGGGWSLDLATAQVIDGELGGFDAGRYTITATLQDTAGNQALAQTNFLVTRQAAGFVVSNFAGATAAGDFNGDGLSDLVAGEPTASPVTWRLTSDPFEPPLPNQIILGAVDRYSRDGAGEAGLVLGGQTGSLGQFRFIGNDLYDAAGSAVSGVGDLNGDGLDDVIISAPRGEPGPADFSTGTFLPGPNYGQAYVVFGRTEHNYQDLAFLQEADIGFLIKGETDRQFAGARVASAGDVNADGLTDLLISTAHPDNDSSVEQNRTYVVYGKAVGSTVELEDVASGSGGFVIDGVPGESTADAIASAGDLNGDGFADLIIGAPTGDRDSSEGDDAGAAYVVYGAGNNSNVDFNDITRGFPGIRLAGDQVQDGFGTSVANAGDVNGDGFADLIISAPFADPLQSASNPNGPRIINAGSSYLVFGGSDLTHIDARDIAAGIGGFAIHGDTENERSGWSVSGGGDVNGDGLSDVVIGSFNSDGGASGRSYVVFGSQDTSAINLASIRNGEGGFVIDGAAPGDRAGTSVSIIGDVNGDGLADLAVGHDADGSPAYVVFGKTDTVGVDLRLLAADVPTHAAHAIDVQGDADNNTLSGSAADELIVGHRGNDVLIGNGGNDAILGGAGHDQVVLNASNLQALSEPVRQSLLAHVDGGSGADTLRLVGTDLTLDLTKIDLGRIRNIEYIELNGGQNTLVLAPHHLLSLQSDTAINTLKVMGSAQDKVDLRNYGFADSGTDRTETNSLGTTATYDVFVTNTALMPNAQLWVKQDIQVLTAPAVLTISSDHDGATAASDVTFTFTFSKPVSGFVSSDILVRGGTKGALSGTDTTYTLIVTPNADSNDPIEVSVAADVATDLSGEPGSTAASFNQAVDTARPTVIITDTFTNTLASGDGNVTFTLKFSEAVTGLKATPGVFGGFDDNITVSGGVIQAFSGSGDTYTLEVTPNSNSTDDIVVSVAENAAWDGVNNGNAAVTARQAVDTQAPTLTITDNESAGITNSAVTFSFAFSEAVTGFDTDDIRVTGGSKGTFIGSGNNYTLVVTPDANSSQDIGVFVDPSAVIDAAGNPNTQQFSASQSVDTVKPTVTITNAVATSGDIDFTFTFSEAVTGFDIDDIEVTGGIKGTFIGGGNQYTLTVSPTGSVDVGVSVAADLAFDGVGNGNEAASAVQMVADNVAPVATLINSGIQQFDGFSPSASSTTPTVLPLGSSGTYIVAWSGQAALGADATDVFLQLVDGSGNALASAVRLSVDGIFGEDNADVQLAPIGTNGAFVAVWSGVDTDGDTSIYVQRFNADGTLNSSQVKLEASASSFQNDSVPQVAALGGNGAFAVVWQGEDINLSTFVYLQRFTSAGALDGSVVRLTHAEPSGDPLLGSMSGVYNDNPQITPLESALGYSGHLVVWSGTDGSFTDGGIFLQRFAADGTANGGLIRLDAPGVTGLDSVPQAAALTGGKIAITWSGDDSDGDTSVFAQLLNADGTLAHTNAVKLEGTDSRTGFGVRSDENPQIAAVGTSGEYVVAWLGDAADGSAHVYVQRFDANGSASGSSVELEAAAFGASPPKISALDDGEWVVTWQGIDSGGDSSVLVQRFNADGTRASASATYLEPPGVSSGSDYSSQVAQVGNSGEFVVVWDGDNSASGTSIFVQPFNADGTVPSGGISAASTEVGTAYLVNSAVTVNTLTDITSAADNQFNAVAIASANIPTVISTAGLAPGTYQLYTADAAGNLSDPASGTHTVTPVVLDLDGDGLEYLALEQSMASFDFDGDGVAERTAWVGAEDGLLALDVDNDGRIDQRSELVFADYLEGANTDLEGLVLFDSNANGLLDSGDAQWNQFVVWQDVNSDGTSDSGELRGLSELGIASISLASEAVNAPAVVDGSVFEHGVSTFSLITGAGGAVGDVAFVYEDVTAYQILP